MRTVKIENPNDVKYNYQLYQAIVLVVQSSRLVEIRFRIFLLIKIHKNLVLHSRMLLFLVLRKKMLILSLRSRIMLLSEVMQIRL